MYAEIYAESLNNLSSGKTSWVLGFGDDLSFSTNKEGELTLNVRYRDKETSGNRGGEHNPVTRNFCLRLDSSEVEKLVSAALDGGMLSETEIASWAGLDQVRALELEITKLRRQLKEAEVGRNRLLESFRAAAEMLTSTDIPPAKKRRRRTPL